MTHFHIRHIEDVLPHIDGRSDFIHVERDGYSVIDYVYVLPDSFAHPARVECRGIKFAPDGSVLARPLHKFRNIGEAECTQPNKLDFSRPHTIMEKLDGSMIHTAVIDENPVFMTRMGRTDHARIAERHLSPALREWCLKNQEVTPIFEWTAPDNRIVVRYDESALTLLAARCNTTGAYMNAAEVADATGVPLVRHFEPCHSSAAEFLEFAREVQGSEGFVVRLESGVWVKAKGDDYVLKHRAKDSILQEKNILSLVLTGGLDDVLPLLDEADAQSARDYASQVEAGILASADEISSLVAANDSIGQKEFALSVAASLPRQIRSLAFLVRGGADPKEAVRAAIIASTTSQTRVDDCRMLHGARWAA